ncbi:MAG: tRNA pseudouridine(55) synthase TruB [Gammaproteobacteria bacterium]|nr:tRNA pseudouridine(55) synthase TruB [Gammaproteobacteria bacterium]
MTGTKRPRRPVSGLVLLDKPLGLSSNTALQKVKWLYQAEKAGHTGSLDPLATGLLPICLGQATKLCAYLLDSDKRYLVRGRLGEQTETGDAEGAVVARSDPASVDRTVLESVLPRFRGEIRQVPPMYSALKHGGRRLYELAREGQDVAREPRPVTIFELRLTGFESPDFELDVRCSKGTYIRTLVEDVAAALGQAAHVVALRRLEVAPFRDPRMVTLDDLERAAAAGLAALDALLVPAVQAVAGLPQVVVDADRAFYLSRGQAVRVSAAPRQGTVAVLGPQGELLGIAEMDRDGLVAPRRWMA